MKKVSFILCAFLALSSAQKMLNADSVPGLIDAFVFATTNQRQNVASCLKDQIVLANDLNLSFKEFSRSAYEQQTAESDYSILLYNVGAALKSIPSMLSPCGSNITDLVEHVGEIADHLMDNEVDIDVSKKRVRIHDIDIE